MDFLNAKSAYEAADDPTTTDITALYNNYEAARQAAVDGNANTNLIIGTSLAGAGLALTTVAIILFTGSPETDAPEAAVAFLPFPGMATLSFNISY